MSEPTISLRAIIKDETAAQLRGMAGNLKQVSESANGATRSFGVLDAEVDKLSASLQDQIIKLRAQKEALADPVYRKSAEQAAQLRHEVDKLNEGINSSTKATEKHGVTWSEVVSKYYLASQAFGVVKNGLMSLVDAAKQYDSIRSRLNAAEGSEALGGRDFKEAQEMAKKPGLGFEQVASTMATLRGMKVTAGEAKALILGIGQANASAAGSAEQFGRVMYQIQQSVSLGRLMVEDLRPIVQQIPTLGAAINNTFGTTDADALNKKLKESGKSVREFWLEVAGLGARLPAASDTIQNNLDNMGDAWIRLKNSFADSGAIKAATGTLAKLMDKIAEYREDNERSRDYRWKAEAELYGNGVKWRDQDKIDARAKQMEYEDFVKTEGLAYDKIDKEESERKEADAKKRNDATRQREEEDAKREAKSERERIAAHNRASEANIERNSDGSVTMRDAMSWNADRTRITGGDEDASKGFERREAGREKAEKKQVADAKRQADIDKKLMDDVMKYANAYHKGMDDLQEKETKKLQDENDKRLKAEQDYWRQMEQAATSSIDNVLQTLIMGGGSMKSKLNALLTQGESALISSGVSMLMGAAFAPATGGASLAVPAGMEFLTSIMGVRRASGGQVMGGFIGNENARSGGEYYTPNTPGRIYNSTQQTTNNVGGITIMVQGGGNAQSTVKALERALPRILKNSAANRGQNSRSS